MPRETISQPDRYRGASPRLPNRVAVAFNALRPLRGRSQAVASGYRACGSGLAPRDNLKTRPLSRGKPAPTESRSSRLQGITTAARPIAGCHQRLQGLWERVCPARQSHNQAAIAGQARAYRIVQQSPSRHYDRCAADRRLSPAVTGPVGAGLPRETISQPGRYRGASPLLLNRAAVAFKALRPLRGRSQAVASGYRGLAYKL